MASYYKIPFFIEERDHHGDRLAALGVHLTHIYDPAFHYYVPPKLYISQVTDEAAVLRWTRSVLPVDPCDIGKVCGYLVQERVKGC